MVRFVFLLFLIFLFGFIQGQPNITIRKAVGSIVLDGDLSDAGWQNTDVASNFKQFFPYDTSLANSQTEVRVAYDDQFIYIGAKMFNQGSRKYVTPSLR
ncbi:MAG: hydrolase, partial [Cyclobacteriaceae bacterium]|nr:hydrolase [Cyclobacteriaceae bacterium]